MDKSRIERVPKCCFLTDSGLVALEVEKGMSLLTLRTIQEEMPLAGCTVCACTKPTDNGEQQGGRVQVRGLLPLIMQCACQWHDVFDNEVQHSDCTLT